MRRHGLAQFKNEFTWNKHFFVIEEKFSLSERKTQPVSLGVEKGNGIIWEKKTSRVKSIKTGSARAWT